MPYPSGLEERYNELDTESITAARRTLAHSLYSNYQQPLQHESNSSYFVSNTGLSSPSPPGSQGIWRGQAVSSLPYDQRFLASGVSALSLSSYNADSHAQDRRSHLLDHAGQLGLQSHRRTSTQTSPDYSLASDAILLTSSQLVIPPQPPRLRTAQACEKCRTRKAKCSGDRPTCKRCSTRGLECVYANEGRGSRVRGPSRRSVKSAGIASQPVDDAPPLVSYDSLERDLDARPSSSSSGSQPDVMSAFSDSALLELPSRSASSLHRGSLSLDDSRSFYARRQVSLSRNFHTNSFPHSENQRRQPSPELDVFRHVAPSYFSTHTDYASGSAISPPSRPSYDALPGMMPSSANHPWTNSDEFLEQEELRYIPESYPDHPAVSHRFHSYNS